MNKKETAAYRRLFEEAYMICFGVRLRVSLTESESKRFSNEILERTGLVIGWKSLKNYSQYFLGDSSGREENPSVATLDTLARYVTGAPPTDEPQRKDNESHYPYWFNYRDKNREPAVVHPGRIRYAVITASVVLLLAVIAIVFMNGSAKRLIFTDDFHSLADDSLNARGWRVISKDENYWSRRDETPGLLSLFTLRGDNWPDSGQAPRIRNLLVRKIPSDCFTAEVHLRNFIPASNWEQAGIILLEDTTFTGRSIRFSLAYNDYFGGYPKSRQIILQVIASLGKDFSKPEEIAHQVVFRIGNDSSDVIGENLQHSALRIEKDGRTFRLLFSDGAMPNSAFTKVATTESDMKPRFIGLFALKGFVRDTICIPARFASFSLASGPCKR